MFKGEYEICERCEITAPIDEMFYDNEQLTNGKFGVRLDWYCEDCVPHARDMFPGRVLNRWKDDVR